MRVKPNSSTRTGADGEAASEYYVLGGEHVGVATARRLREAGLDVTLITETRDSADSGVRGTPGDVQMLADAGIAEAATVVVAMPSDSQNLLVAQLVRAHFDVPEIVVLVNTPARHDLFAEVGHEPVCATNALSSALVEGVENVNHDIDQTA